ncbi:DUF4395 family protein [Bacillus sp. FSL W8-0102]|uniref:DUF4395 family protein n=1 Tax=Bacillus sp. FSL W8-0102 TaxID=2978205 RepID=UPI0030F6BBD3
MLANLLIYSYYLHWDVAGYVFNIMVVLAAGIALMGFCIGCFIRYQLHDVETSPNKQNITFRIKKRSNRAITAIFHNISLQKKGMFSQLENMPFSFTSFFMHSFLLEHRIQPASKLSDFINHLFLFAKQSSANFIPLKHKRGQAPFMHWCTTGAHIAKTGETAIRTVRQG